MGSRAIASRHTRYAADPPKAEEIIAVMRIAGATAPGRRVRGLIVTMGAPVCAFRKSSRSPAEISITDAARRRAADRHQRQMGHSALGITSVYLHGIDSGEVIETVHSSRAPMIPVDASLQL